VSWLLDTNAVSETGAKRMNPGFRAWFESKRPEELFTSAVVLGELYRGAYRVPIADPRRAALLTWIESAVVPGFANRIVALDAEVARSWGQLAGELSPGVVVDARDGQIAATAVHLGFVLVTRNVRDMARFGRVTLENPWT